MRRVEQPLQGRFGAADVRLVGPGELAAPNADVADRNRPARVADVQLQPAERLVVEVLEVVDALAADEARPGEEVRIEPGRTVRRVRFLRQDLHNGACRGVDGEARPAHQLLRELESGPEPLAVGGGCREAPAALGACLGNLLADDAIRVGHAELEPIGRVAQPIDSARLRQAPCRHHRLLEGRDLPLAQGALAGIGPIHGIVAGIVAARGRLIGAATQGHGRDPRIVELGFRSVPAVGVQPGVELLLQRA